MQIARVLTISLLAVVRLAAVGPGTLAKAVADPTLTPLVSQNSTGPAVIRAQILLCRANFSVGEIDGAPGINFHRAVLGFQASRKLPQTGNVDKATWKALNADPRPAAVPYIITAADTAGPFEKIPADWTEMAKLPAMGFASVDEELGERFHSNPALLHLLNPNTSFDKPGVPITVPDVRRSLRVKAASIVVSKSARTVIALDIRGKLIAQFPATTGSDHDPLPIGDWKVTTVHHNPTFAYNPDLFWDADSKETRETIAAGPRGPVGVVWIGISKEHYGIHGTAIPSEIGHTLSHGCIRLTNWDALELANAVVPGIPVHLKE